MRPATRAGRSRPRAAPPAPARAGANAARETARASAAAPATWLWGVRVRKPSCKLNANAAAPNVVRHCARSRTRGPKLMRNIGLTVLLLACSNIFMTFAWYAHLKELNNRPWIVAALVSWGIAFFEY